MTTEMRVPASFFGVARRKFIPRWLRCALGLIACTLPALAQVTFTLSSSPRNDFVVPNGQVNAILEHSNVVYIGGAFTQVATNTGHAMFINPTNGSPLGVPPRFDRDVNAALPDGRGGWFIGGDFQAVDYTPKFRLTHLLPDFTLDPNFSADMDGTVNSLILVGTNLYVGGAFTRITNVISLTNSVITSRFRFAILDPLTGAPRTLPSNPSFDASISTLLMDGDRMYVGGTFTRATNILTGLATNVFNRRRSASFSLLNGQVTPFQADVDSAGVNALAVYGATLFMGGNFTNVTNSAFTTDPNGNYRPRRGFAAVDKDTGIPLTNFWVTFDAQVRAFELGSNVLYIGGDFVRVTNYGYDLGTRTYTNDVQQRLRLVALNLPDGTVNTNWTPQPDAPVHDLKLYGTNIYAAGEFNNVRDNGGGNLRALNKVAAITASLTRLSIVSTVFDVDAGGTVNVINMDGTNTFFIGGGFSFTKGVSRNRLAAFNATTGQVLPWNPNANNIVRAMTVFDTNIFVGGDFTQFGVGVNTSNRARIAALDMNLGLTVAKYTNGVDDVVRALVHNGTNLYIGGDFVRVTNRGGFGFKSNVASMVLATGDILTNSSAFTANIGMSGAVITATNVNALALFGTNLYIGGPFTSVNRQPRFGLAAVNTISGEVNPDWVCDVDGGSNVLALAVSGSSLIVGGQFLRLDVTRSIVSNVYFDSATKTYRTNFTGPTTSAFTRNRIAALGLNDGSVNVTWNPNSPNHVMSLATRGTNLYVGGRFAGTIGGQSRNRLAEISTLTAATTPWNPDADDVIWSLFATSNRVYAGGTFTLLGATTNLQAVNNFAVFDSTNAVPVVTLNTNTIIYDEQAPAVRVDGALRVSDANHAAFTNAVIIVSNYFAVEDSFTITQAFGVRVTSAVTSNRLTLTLSGRAGVPTYQQLLRTLTYTNTSLSPTQAVRSVQITVADPAGAVSVPVVRSISVRPLNSTPTLDRVASIIQLAGQPASRTVPLTGISSGGDSNQVLTLTAASSDNSIAQPLLIYANGTTNSTGSLLFTNLTRIGTATISVVVRDNGGTNNGSIDAVTNTFFIRVVASNSAPTMNSLANLTIQQDTGPYTNILTGINSGGNSQLTITVTSSDDAVMPDPTVIYSAPDTTAQIIFSPVARVNGVVTNTILLRNGGLTNNSATNSFAVTIRPNVVPTLNPIADVFTNVSASVIAVPMTGITAGAGANQFITITAGLSSFTNFYFTAGYATTNLFVTNYSSTNLTFTNLVGTNSIVTNVLVSRLFVTNTVGGNVTVTNFYRTNFSPVLADSTNILVSNLSLTNFASDNTVISNFTVTNVTVTLITTNLADTNITVTRVAIAGTVALTDISSDTISGLNVVYASPNTNGTIFVTPAPGVVGTGVVSVLVRDNGGVLNGGADRITNSLKVVLAPNRTPTLDPIPNIVTNVSPGPVYVILTGISAGAGESQQLTVTASSDNPGFVNPVVTYYSSPDRFALVDVTPLTGAVSSATITVVVRDNGGTAGGAVDAVTNTFSITTLANTPPFFRIAAYDFITDIPYFIDPTNFVVAQGAITNLWLTNISPGIVTPGNTNLGQTLTFEVKSSNPNLIMPAATYTSANPTGILSMTPERNASGTALISIILRDNGGTTNGGVDSYTNTFVMTVIPSLSDFARNDFPFANGPVNALLETNGVLYLGGSFTELGTNTGKAVPVNATSGNPLGTFLKFDRDVNVIIPDGTNGWYVGGVFQSVSGVPRQRLARLNQDFSVDANFTADFDSTVNALALVNGELYVGGAFLRVTNYVNGLPVVASRLRYAVLDKTNGTPTRVSDPQFDNSINAIAVQQTVSGINRVYVGGAFTRITSASGAVSLFRVALLDGATGTPLTSFQADADAGTVRALTISLDGLTLFVGGDFTRLTNGLNTFSRFRLAAVSTTTGAASGFLSDMSAPVNALWFMSNAVPARLIAGGDFTTITGRNITLNVGRIASLDSVLGDPSTVWTPGVNGSVNALWQSGPSIYVGGAFTSVTNVFGGASTSRRRAVALSTNMTATAIVQAWDPAPSAAVNAIAVNRAGVAYVGGAFNFTRGVIRNRLGAVESATGGILPWNPNANNSVFALATAYLGSATNGSNVIYAGGQFTTVAGSGWQRLVMLNTNAYDTNGTNPTVIATFTNGFGDVLFTNGFNNTIRALAVGPTNLYVGGDFTNYRSINAGVLTNITTNVTPRFGLAAVDPANGALRTNFMANTRAVGTSNVMVLAFAETNLYVGGSFLNITNRTTIYNKARLALLEPNSGRPVDAFENNFNGPVLALQPAGSNLLVGGNFSLSTNSKLAVVRHRNYALLDATSGAGRISDSFTGFDPWVNQRVFSLANRADWLYMGGLFSVGTNSIGANAVFRNRLAELTLPPGGASAFTEWNPDMDAEVFSLLARGDRLYAGGQFTMAGQTSTRYGRPLQGLAVYESNSPPVIIPSPSQTIYTIGDPPISVDSGLLVRDPNGALLARATVQITTNYVLGEDVLAYVSVANGITGSFNPTNGMLTLTGVAPIETYQTALRAVTYLNTQGSFMTVSKRRLEFTVDDGLGYASVGTASQTLNVVRINVAPTMDAVPNFTWTEDTVTNLLLTGITSGAGDSNDIVVRVFSSNTNLFIPTLAYTNPADTALLGMTPLTNNSGTAVITVILQDDGGTTSGGVDSLTNTFSIVVLPVNDPPTISGPTDTVYLNEHINPVPLIYSIGLSNITVGPPNEQSEQSLITFTAASSDTNLIPNPTIVFANANGITTGRLELTVAPNQRGSTNPPTIITMILRDNGGTNNGGVDSVTNTFLLVIRTNFPPTLDPIANLTTNSSPGTVTVPLTGISGGGGVIEGVTFTATSSDTNLIPSVTITPASSTNVSTALLSFTPVATNIGTALITVIGRDRSGLSGPGSILGVNQFGVDAVTNTFVVTIRTNAVPTLGAIPNIVTNTSPGTMALLLTNISMGAGEGGQLISVSARCLNIFSTNVGSVTNVIVSSNVAYFSFTNVITNANLTTNEVVTLIASNFVTTNFPVSNFAVTNFTVDVLVDTNYASPGSNAVLYLTPRSGLTATSTVEVVVRDNGGSLGGGRDAVTNTFLVTTLTNRPPTLTLPFNSLRVFEDPGLLTVTVTGITTGDSTNNTDGQMLTLVATSDKPALITPVVDYFNPNTTASINITPALNASGTAVITVTVFDDGGGGLARSSFSTNFTVIIDPGLADLPRHNFIVANGPVQSLVATNNTLYFGGGFTEVGTNTGHAVPVDTSTGDLLTGFPLVERGVNVTIPDGQGGWYLGGDFVTVGGASRFRLAHLTSNLTVDPKFTPNFDNTVNTLLLSGTNLYVGGAFTFLTNNVDTTITTITTNFATNLVLVTNITRVQSNIVQSPPLINIATNSVVVQTGTITNSTNFIAVLVTNRFRFAVLDPVTGVPRSFINPVGTNRFVSNPAFNGTVLALGLITNSSSLYFGGNFTSVTNVNIGPTLTNLVTNNRVRLAKMDLLNGRIDNNFFADADAVVRAIAIDERPGIGSVVYAGGDFVRVTNTQNVLPLARLAALNSTLGSVDNTRPWTNHFNASVRALLLSETNLVIGGDFTLVTNAAGITPRSRLAVIDTTAGTTGGVHAVNLVWSNNVNGSVQALAMDRTTNAAPANTLYIGGSFTTVNDVPRRRAAALDADFTVDTSVTPVVQPFDPAMSGPVLALAVSGPRAYLGGSFSFMRGALRSRLAAVNLATGELLPWNPDMNGNVLTLAIHNSNVYAGGQFTLVTNIFFGSTNVVAPGRLAVLNPTNGLVVQSFSNSFNNTVRALAVGGSNLFVGGDFTLVTNGGLTNVRVGLAAVNPTNGALNSNFVINAVSATTSNVLALSYVRSSYYGDRLFVGGAFTLLGASATLAANGTVVTSGGAVRQRLASISLTDNTIDFGFNCNLNGAVTSLIGSETNVYVAGEFTTTVNSTGNNTVNRLFAADSITGDPYVIGFDPVTDVPLFWAPNANGRVNSISALPASTNLYAGGTFTALGGTNRLRMAELNKSEETNNATLWNPTPDSDVFTVLATPSRVVVGGSFSVLGPLPIQGLAVFERNVPTVLQGTPSPLTYTTGIIPPLQVFVDPAVQIIDPNVAFITNAIVRFEANASPVGPVYISGEDVLLFSPTNGVTGAFDPLTGVLTLGGSGTVDQYQDALRSIQYVNLNPIATNLLRQVSFIVNDGSSTRLINVIATNYAPTLDVFYRPTGSNYFTNITSLPTPKVLVINEDAGFTNLLLTNITSGSNILQFLTVTATSSDTTLFPPSLMSVTYNWPSNSGTLRFASLTNLPFTTNPMSAVISVVVRDDGGTLKGGVDAFTNTFTVTVMPVNDAPTLAPIANITIVEDNGGAPLVVPLDQIRPGGSELQFVTVSAVSSNPGLIPNSPANLLVNYNFPDSTGFLRIIPAANQRGITTLAVTVQDDGGTNRVGDVDRITRTFTISVVDQNDQPTMTPLPDLTIFEDSGPTNFSLLNITPGGGTNEAGQQVTVSAFVSNTNLVAAPLLAYTPSTNYPTSGTLTITPLTNAFGVLTVTVLVKDDNGTANGGVDTLTNTFRLTITNVNDAPTINPLTNLVLSINPPLQLVQMTGIAAGPTNESAQIFTVNRTVVASPSTLLTTAGVTNTYLYPNTTGLLSFRPATNVSGTATITVTLLDNGGTANGGKNATTNSFTVIVMPTNSRPTFVFETNAVTIGEDAGVQTMNLTNVTAGLTLFGPETQPLTMSVVSSDTNLVRIISTNYTSPNTTGQILYASRTNANGTATITVIVRDNGGTTAGGVDAFTNTFRVTVLPVNDAPTLGVLTNLAFFPSPGPQTVLVTNITPGGGPDEAGQGLTLSATVTATSNPLLIQATPVTYVSPNTTGLISFTPAAGEQGTATITVVAQDTGGTALGGVDAKTNTFLLQISANASPTLDPIANLTLYEDPGRIVIPLTGISAGPYNEASQILTITADAATVIPPKPVLFSENFESGLGQWTGTNGGTNQAAIVLDPLASGRGNVLTFTGLNTIGDLFTTNVFSTPYAFEISFDYLGLAQAGSVTDDFGGMVGISPGLNDVGETWIAATSDIYSNAVQLVDDGQWHRVTVTLEGTNAGAFRLKLQDWLGSAGVAGDAYFDNITIQGYTNLVTPVISSNLLTLIYTNGQSTGQLRFTPAEEASGTATITITLKDNGGTPPGGIDTLVRTFTVTVLASNDPPTMNLIGNMTMNEDAPLQTLLLSGISTGGSLDETRQIVTMTFSNSNPALFPDLTNFVISNFVGTVGTSLELPFAPAPNQSGIASITVLLKDNGGTINGSPDTLTNTFTITVLEVNDQPTLNPLPDIFLLEDSGTQFVPLTGITAGAVGVEAQSLTVTASASDTNMIPSLTLSYSSPATTGLLTFTPALDAYGFVTISVTVQDSGGTTNGGVDTLVSSFVVNITPVNDPPTMAPMANIIIVEDSGWQLPAPTNFNFVQTVILTNISAGPGEIQPLTFTVTSTNTALIPTPTLLYTQGLDSAILTFRPTTNANGVSRINIVVRDDGSSALGGPMAITNSFLVTVLSANDPPKMNLLTNIIMYINAGTTNVPLAGINAGAANESGQAITFQVTTESTNFITQPTVIYTSPATTGTLRFSTLTNVTGTETVTILVQDTGGTANGGYNTLTNTFLVEVRPINVAPTMDAFTNVTMLEDAPALTIPLNNITAGGGEFQNITITAFSSDTTIIPNPTLFYTNNDVTGTLTFRPRTNANTEVLTNNVLTNIPVVITVIARDNGGTVRGGVDTLISTFEVTVWPVNDQPRFLYVTNLAQTNLAFGNMTFLEDSGPQVLDVFGIDPGATNENQTLQLRAFSSNTNLIATNLTVTYTSPATNGQLTFTPRANQYGTSLITVTLRDNGSTTNGGVDLFTNTFVITVLPVNDPPVGTMNTLNLTILEDSGFGIPDPRYGVSTRLRFTNLLVAASAVTNEANQALIVTATTFDTNTITVPKVIYTSPDNFGFISFAPLTNQIGTALVEVVFFDTGGSTNGGVDAITNLVNITITPVNDPPTIDKFSNYVVKVNSGVVNVPMSGITVGPTNEIGQTLTMTAYSSSLSLIGEPVIDWNPTNSVGTLFFQPQPNAFGTATITVIVTDDGGRQNTPFGTPRGIDAVTNTFEVLVTRGNTPPTIDPVADVIIDEGAGPQRIDLSGISAGRPVNEATQSLSITISSSNPTLVDPVLNFTYPATTGNITFTPPLDGNGSAVITITLKDNGGTATNGVDTTVHSIYVTVNPVNDPPTLDPILTNFTVLEDSGPVAVDFSGVAASAIAGELQTLKAFAFSSNTNILLTPTVVYTSPSSTGRVVFQPASNGYGTATVSVVVQDNGGTAFNGIDSVTQAFTVVVLPVNDAPTISTTTNRIILEDSGNRTINFTNVTSGAGESNLLTFTVLSSRPDLISGGNVIFTNTNGVATLVFAANTNAFGTNMILVTNLTYTNMVVQNSIVTNFDGFNFTVSNILVTNFVATTEIITNVVALHPSGQAILTVVVQDDGGTDNGGVDTVTTSFMVEVLPVNDPPRIDPFTNRVSLLVDAGPQTIPLSGLAPGPANESLQVFYDIVVTNLVVTLTNQEVPVPVDIGIISNNTVVVSSQIIIVTNQVVITTNEVVTNAVMYVTNQSLTITAISSNPGLVPNPQVNYLDQDSTGELVFTPAAGQTGSATITVILTDDGGRANGGINASTNTFLVTVFAQNAQPTLSFIPNLTLVEGVTVTNVNLYGISAGGGEGQNLTVTATSSNTNIVRNNNIIVDYISPDSTGNLIFSPQPNVSGITTISVIVRDDGGTIGGLDAVTNTFTVTLISINDAPGLNPIPDITIYENDPVVPVLLTNIFAGGPGEGGQSITITAFSSDTNVIRNPTISYISPQSTGLLNLIPAGDLNGDATITVIVRDNGGTALGGIDASTNFFLVTVIPVNDAPRFTVTNMTILEDSLARTNFITNITTGATNEFQLMTVTAFSSDTSIIPDPIVLYTNTVNTNGQSIANAQIIVQPLTNMNGVVTISVVVKDDGGTDNGGIDTTTNTFTLTVLPVNDPPSFNPIANLFVQANSGARSVLITGLVPGPADETNQTMTVTAFSSNPALMDDPLVDYSSPDDFANLVFQPITGASGTVTITVLVDDNGSLANGGLDLFVSTFRIIVTRGNLPPTMAPLTNMFLPENAGPQTLLLSNITSGGGSESGQTISITSTSSAPFIIPNPGVSYVSPETNGILTFTPVANTSGVASISVVVRDSGSTSNGGFNAITNTFTVTIFSAASRTLQIERFGETNIVSWPFEATTNGFSLQMSTDLFRWNAVSQLPVVISNINYYTNVTSLTNAPGLTNNYFRLYRP